MATKTLECGCSVEWPENNNCAAKNRAKAAHEEACATWKAIRDQRRADVFGHAARDNSGGLSRSAYLRGDYERHIVDSYWGDGTYDSDFTTDDMVDEAMGG